MTNKVDITIINQENIPESTNYIDVTADSVVNIGTGVDGHEILTMVFMNSVPVVSNDKGSLSITGIEKRKVASVSLGKAQAEKFYHSLKSIFEE